MKCDRAEQEILLDDAGELSWFRAQRLKTHLTDCAQCRAYRQDVRRIEETARSLFLGNRLPGPNAMSTVLAAAAAHPTSPALVRRRPILRPLAACAAGLLLLLGTWMGFDALQPLSDSTTPAPQATRVAEINSLLGLTLLTSGESAEQAHPINGEEEDLKALAERILILEGFHLDAPGNG